MKGNKTVPIDVHPELQSARFDRSKHTEFHNFRVYISPRRRTPWEFSSSTLMQILWMNVFDGFILFTLQFTFTALLKAGGKYVCFASRRIVVSLNTFCKSKPMNYCSEATIFSNDYFALCSCSIFCPSFLCAPRDDWSYNSKNIILLNRIFIRLAHCRSDNIKFVLFEIVVGSLSLINAIASRRSVFPNFLLCTGFSLDCFYS